VQDESVPFKAGPVQSLVLPALLLSLVSTVAAQTPVPHAPAATLRPSMARAVWAPADDGLRRSEAPEPLGGFLGPGDEDHRYPGFFIGAGLGLFGTLVAVEMCTQDTACDSRSKALAAGVLASVMFGLGGAVIGGLIPKSPSP
jgi:hypothetical protein